MTILRPLLTGLFSIFLVSRNANAQNFNVRGEIEKAAKQTLPRAAKSIEESTDARLALEVDAASFGDDEKAWSNLQIIASRIVAAFTEVGKDQVGKDAIAKSVKKVVIVKLDAGAKEDAAELKDDALIVQTAATDNAVSLLQGVITKALEKIL